MDPWLLQRAGSLQLLLLLLLLQLLLLPPATTNLMVLKVPIDGENTNDYMEEPGSQLPCLKTQMVNITDGLYGGTVGCQVLA